MSITPIGLLTIIAGVACLLLGYRATFATLVVATLFGAAAAVLIGPNNIQPAHLLVAFAAAATLTRSEETAAAFGAMHFPKPGFWLTCLVLYGVVSAFIVPRLMAGITPIIPLGTSEYANTGSTVPLGPVSSNFTQSVYLTADLICFAITAAIASTQAGFVTITGALLAYAAGNVLFALLDIGTYATGTQWLLDFMRNAQYTLHLDDAVNGLKRIVGSFTEASAFARSTLGALGFTGTLFLCGRSPMLTGPLAAASLVLVVLSTSSTGLAGTAPVLLILYATALFRSGFHLNRPYRSAAVLCAPLVVIAAVLAILLNDAASESLRNYFDLLIFNKSTSDSGIERDSWNAFALQNFFDSDGLGVGLGTARVSSFPLALLSNVGVPGTIFYLFFAASALAIPRGTPRTFWADVRLAARNACLALIIGDTFAAPSVEQGLLFYVLAGMACAEPERGTKGLSAASSQLTGARP
ncbi:hypothetical protein [Bradyrhizobium sp. dw_78]|uniref:hypothetical protein n=1 Tax=Bradyrhizobium sp. dw_78 TaxID=2719793 RepID=UPI001BD2BE12|nr:hypothetical protein [Bradyrhizobium sp. dw_78]